MSILFDNVMQSLIATKKLMINKIQYNNQGKPIEYVFNCLCNWKCRLHAIISIRISKSELTFTYLIRLLGVSFKNIDAWK